MTKPNKESNAQKDSDGVNTKKAAKQTGALRKRGGSKVNTAAIIRMIGAKSLATVLSPEEAAKLPKVQKATTRSNKFQK